MHTFTRLLISLAVSATLFLAMPASAGPVDINTADAAALASAMNGVGEVKAATIVAYRETHGGAMAKLPVTDPRSGALKIFPTSRELVRVP